MPGTPDASPSTQISFLGPAGTQVQSVEVSGSRSGTHAGRLEAYSTGTGESFLPSHPFTPGERVHVVAHVLAAGASEEAATSFVVAHQASVKENEFPLNRGSTKDVQHFGSAPELTPSALRVTTPPRPGASAGDLFLAPYQARGTAGPMIAEQNGAMVWFHPLPQGHQATNFRVQEYEGKEVLTWWQGRIIEVGFGQGEDVVYDSAYKQIATIRAGNGYHADLHEFKLTPQGTAWIDIFDPIHMDLGAVHRSHAGILTDGVVEEVDVKTGLVMWQWHTLGNISLSESHNPAPKGAYPWDYVHLNSVDPGSSGDVLLSGRNTWALYDVDMHTGAIRWRMGGDRSSFRQGQGAHYFWQHDAEWQPGGLISVFDNGSSPPKERQSRGLLLRPDYGGHTVSLQRQFVNPSHRLLASSQGNLLSLGDGNWLMGYGGLPNLTEYSGSGGVLLDAALGKEVQNFRTYFAPWHGSPPGAPAIVAHSAGAGRIAVSVSWNGATEVASWQVQAGASPTALAPVASAPKRGFETSVTVSGGPYVAVQALDAAGHVLGTSRQANVS
jgi:hypothetical protein